MQDRYIADEAKVNISSLEAETVMKSTPVSTVTSILGRIGIEYEEGLSKEAYIAAFKEGIVLDNGYKCKKANLQILETGEAFCKVQIEIFEGKFHQVKKMVESCGKHVTYLKRLKIKDLSLDRSLELGDFRELTDEELVDLMNDL